MGVLSGLLSTQDSSDIPVMGTAVNITATGGGGTFTATIPALPGQTAYLTGFEISSGGATAGALLTSTITGLVGGTYSIVYAIPTGNTLSIAPIWVSFYPAIPASGANVALVLTVPGGAGRSSAAASLQGFYL